MKIQVTQEHINAGRGNRSYVWNCVALAVQEATGDKFSRVGMHTTQVRGKEYRNPQSAIDCVRDLDAGRSVQPFEFELPIEEAA